MQKFTKKFHSTQINTEQAVTTVDFCKKSSWREENCQNLRKGEHKIIGSMQNNSGHGIDLVTKKNGKYYFWEVKGSTANNFSLSPAQAKGRQNFVTSRLNRALIQWKNMTPGEKKLAGDLLEAIRLNKGHVRGGIIRVGNIGSGTGCPPLSMPKSTYVSVKLWRL